MLVLALGATLVGFILLVAALFSGVLWLAIACIVVCVVGVGFLVADLLGLGGRSESEDAAEENQDRDRSAEPDREEGSDPGSSGGAEGDDHTEWEPESQPESDDTDTGPIPRVSRHGASDDPPTEEIRLDKPR